MTLLNPDGTLLSKEIYKYEFDFAGNWNKMTTSVAVVDARGITFEASEVTHRATMYYLDENMVKMVTPGSTTTTPEATTPPTAGKPPVADPKANAANASANKSHNNSKAVTPDLPAASNAATKLAAGPVDVKSPSATSTQTVPVVNLDSEPPPTTGPRPILKPISGGVLNGPAVSGSDVDQES